MDEAYNWSVVVFTERVIAGYLEPDDLFWEDGLQIQNSPHPRRGLQKLLVPGRSTNDPKNQPPVVKLGSHSVQHVNWVPQSCCVCMGEGGNLPENGVREKWVTSRGRAKPRRPECGKPSPGGTFVGGGQ